MFRPYESELCRALGPSCRAIGPATIATSVSYVNEDLTQRGIATECDGTGTESAQNPTNAQSWYPSSPTANISSQPMYIPYQSGPYFPPDPIYGTVAVSPDPPVYETHGSDAELEDTADEQSASPQISLTATQSASCRGARCRWYDEGTTCGTVILCEGVPAHLRDCHRIRGINECQLVKCKWEGCFATGKRKNIVRHIRECHLGHSRERGHSF